MHNDGGTFVLGCLLVKILAVFNLLLISPHPKQKKGKGKTVD